MDAHITTSTDPAGHHRAPRGETLSLTSLTAMVMGSMIGAGIFGMPAQLAAGTAMGPMLIGWAVTGIGMLALALVFQSLAIRRPDLDAGIFSYARAGLGDLVGSLSAFGYWLAATFGNVAYVVLVMATLSTFFPALGGGETVISTVIGSIIAWLYGLLVMRGVKEAASVNMIVTIAKLVPLAAFLVFGVAAFRFGVAFDDAWGTGGDLGSVTTQVASMMLITVWAFLGVEGASNLSARSRRREDVGRATVIGFLSVLVLLIAVNVLSYGMVHRAELAGMADPSMAHVLESSVGAWGVTLVGVGLLLAIGGAFLSWQLTCAEILDLGSREGLLPRFLSVRNKHDAPYRAVLMSVGTIQFFLILNLVFHDPEAKASLYTKFVYLATSMSLLPYLFSALYQVLLSLRDKTRRPGRARDLTIGVVGLIYAIWLVYAGGLSYLLTSAILYVVGLGLFLWARHERGETLLKGREKAVVAVVVATAVLGCVMLANGTISV